MNGTAARLVRGDREWRRHTSIEKCLIPRSAIPQNPCSSTVRRHRKHYSPALCPIPAISLDGGEGSIVEYRIPILSLISVI